MSGEWLHCNVCCRVPKLNDQMAFFLTSCGHILCSSCIGVEHSGKCRVCRRTANSLEINHKMRSDLRIFFRDPKDLVEEYMKNINKVLVFQAGHRSRLQKAWREQNLRAAKLMASADAELKKKATAEKVMTAETNKLREEADRLRRRCETLETKISELKAEGRRRVRSPASLGMNRSFASSRSSDRNSRSSLEFSFIVPGTCRSDHQNVRPESTRHNALFERLPETMLNESTEPSSIVADSLVTTPAILGIGKSERSKRMSGGSENAQLFDFRRW